MRWRPKPTTFARFSYLGIAILIALVLLVSCLFIISQAVRTAPNRSFERNFNALVIGLTYAVILVFSLVLCVNRRLSVRIRLSRIPKNRVAVGKGDVPKIVQTFIEEEFLRSCAIAYAAHPKLTPREGWGIPGGKYDGIRFRTTLLDTVPLVDDAARKVIPSMPPLPPNIPLEKHLRHIKSLVSVDEDGERYFRDYTSAVQLSRYASRELTEVEFDGAMVAGENIRRILEAYRVLLAGA